MTSLQRTLIEAVLIASLGVLTGLAINHRLVLDAFAGRLVATGQAAGKPGAPLPQPVLLHEVRQLVAAGALPVDARDGAVHADGHLPGAFSLPLGEADSRLAAFSQRTAPERTLIVYCNGYGCEDSFDLAQRLIAAGYQDVRVFEGGFPEWRAAGLPVAQGEK